MANYASLLATIANNITDNNSGAITGPILKSVLDSMVGSLGTGYQFMGVATTSTNPGTPDQKVYYLAGPGTYTNFNGLVVADGEIAILKYDSAWSKVTTPIASADEVSQLGQKLIQLKGVGGSSADVAPLSIGDIYYNYTTRLLREKIGSGETSADYRTIPYLSGAIYTIGNELYKWDASQNIIVPLFDKIIYITHFGTSGGALNWGETYYNTNSGLLRRKISANDYITIPFAVDSIYIYNNGLYLWDGEQLNNINQKIDDELGITTLSITGSNKYILLSGGVGSVVPAPTNSDTYDYIRASVGADDIIIVNGIGGGGARLWAFVDGNGVILSVSAANITGNNLLLVPPTGAAEIIINTSNPLSQCYILKSSKIAGKTAQSSDYINSVKEFLPIVLNIYDSDNITAIISAADKWYRDGQYSGQLYDISQWRGRTLQITGNANNVTYFAFLTTNEINIDSSPDFCQGYGGRIGVELGGNYVVEIPEDANYLYCGNGNNLAVSAPQKIAILAQDIKVEEEVTISMEGLETDIIATTRNYILKFLSENGNYYLEHSDDLGETWKRIQWPDADICFVHWFSDGTCLIASHSHCYWTEDFVTLHQSSVYDVDGTAFVPNSYHFYKWGNYNSEYHKINGNEVVFWSDYNGGGDGVYQSRIWMTTDNGHTIRAIAKSGTTKDTDNNTINVRHFHQTCFVDKTETLYVTTGDDPAQCMLLRGTISNGVWSWEKLVSGSAYKYGQIFVNDLYVFLITDITFTGEDTGIVMCPVEELANPDAYKYIFRIKDVFPGQQEDTYPITGYFEDVNGNRLIFPDGIGYNVLWYAYGDMDFKLIHIQYNQNLSFQCVWGANYNGDCVITGVTGYTIADTRTMSQPRRFLLTKAMRDAGIDSFCRQPMLFV